MYNRIIKPNWSLHDYQDLLDSLALNNQVISLKEYIEKKTGIWIRHDIELDHNSAIDMAKCENRNNIKASYFICYESPYLPKNKAIELAATLRSLGHEVGIHRIWKMSYLAEYAKELKLSQNEYQKITYHAPGIEFNTIWKSYPKSSSYRDIYCGAGQYFSDSTGKWKWGNPRKSIKKNAPIQLLVHPFWWSAGKTMRSIEIYKNCVFLPQIVNGN